MAIFRRKFERAVVECCGRSSAAILLCLPLEAGGAAAARSASCLARFPPVIIFDELLVLETSERRRQFCNNTVNSVGQALYRGGWKLTNFGTPRNSSKLMRPPLFVVSPTMAVMGRFLK